MCRAGIEVGALRTADRKAEARAAAGAALAGLSDGAGLRARAAVFVVRLNVDARGVTVGLARGARAATPGTDLAGGAHRAASAAVVDVHLQVDTTDAVAEVLRRTRRADALSGLAQSTECAGVIARAAMVGVRLEIDAARNLAVVRPRAIWADARTAGARPTNATGIAARAAVVGVRRRVRAGACTITRQIRRADASTARAQLIGKARIAAFAAMCRVVVGDGHAIADTAVVDLPVAVVVETVAAHLGCADQLARADLELRFSGYDAAPIER
jgi:hypothetical protein